MEILEFCVEKLQSQKLDKFELFWEKSSSLSIEIKDGKLDHLSRATDEGLAIRVLKNQKMGFSYTFDLSRNAVEKAVRTALEIAELMPADPLNDLPTLAPSYAPIESFDATGIEAPLDDKIHFAQSIESIAKKQDKRITRVRSSGLDESYGDMILVDSSGRQAKHRASFFAAHLSCVAEEGGDAEIGHDGQYATHLSKLNATDVAHYATASALELLHGSAAPTMTCPVVLKNSVVAQLIGFLSSSFSAENIDKNFSLLIGKKGEKLFSDKINLTDDGLMPGGLATSPFDGEGTPSQKNVLIDSGVVKGYLYDNYYARKHGTKSTASSRRGSIKAAPGIGPTNLYLNKGQKSLTELFATISKGVYITNVMGLHTANPVTGEFSIGASGVLIENGRLTRPVKGFAIAGNLISLLRDVSEVGSDIRFWGGMGTPSLLVSQLSISGK